MRVACRLVPGDAYGRSLSGAKREAAHECMSEFTPRASRVLEEAKRIGWSAMRMLASRQLAGSPPKAAKHSERIYIASANRVRSFLDFMAPLLSAKQRDADDHDPPNDDCGADDGTDEHHD